MLADYSMAKKHQQPLLEAPPSRPHPEQGATKVIGGGAASAKEGRIGKGWVEKFSQTYPCQLEDVSTHRS
jgi:hypothetical protein